MTSILATEGGWQTFTLKGGEWLILGLSGASAILALLVGWYLMIKVLQEDEGTDKMKEIAGAIQVGALAYLKRQFRTIGMILVPVGAVVFLTSVAIDKPEGGSALSFVESGLYRTLAHVSACCKCHTDVTGETRSNTTENECKCAIQTGLNKRECRSTFWFVDCY